MAKKKSLWEDKKLEEMAAKIRKMEYEQRLKAQKGKQKNG